MTTTVTFRTDAQLKAQASELFDKMGLNLSLAINLFLTEAVNTQRYPCSLSLDRQRIPDTVKTYPAGFFSLFGAGRDLGMDEEPEDFPPESEEIEL